MSVQKQDRVAHHVPQETTAVDQTPSLKMVRAATDFFEHRYYRLNKILMTLIGQWPYQSSLAKRAFPILFIILSTFHIIPRILAVIKYRDDWRIVLDCVIPSILDAISGMKLFTFMQNSQKTLMLVNHIRKDWQVWARDREVNVLHQYAEQGCKITMGYTAILYSHIVIFMTQPIAAKFIDVLLNNGTEPAQLPTPADYYSLDVQKYYLYLFMYYYVCVLLISTVSITGEVMLITYVQHVCSIFTAVGLKLERIGNNDTSVEASSDVLEEKNLLLLTTCMNRHNDAVEYADLIKASYTWIFFIVIGCGVILVNVIGFQILLRTNDPETTTRFIVMALAVTMYFYMDCLIAQILMDHSISICFYIYNSQWYRLWPKTQKLLQFMMMRCSIPCQLTAGKVFLISVRTFWVTAKTTISYFTFLRSTNGL